MATQQDNHQQGAVMALNGWSIEDIQTFSLKLNMPHDATEQMIEGYVATRGKHTHNKRLAETIGTTADESKYNYLL